MRNFLAIVLALLIPAGCLSGDGKASIEEEVEAIHDFVFNLYLNLPLEVKEDFGSLTKKKYEFNGIFNEKTGSLGKHYENDPEKLKQVIRVATDASTRLNNIMDERRYEILLQEISYFEIEKKWDYTPRIIINDKNYYFPVPKHCFPENNPLVLSDIEPLITFKSASKSPHISNMILNISIMPAFEFFGAPKNLESIDPNPVLQTLNKSVPNEFNLSSDDDRGRIKASPFHIDNDILFFPTIERISREGAARYHYAVNILFHINGRSFVTTLRLKPDKQLPSKSDMAWADAFMDEWIDSIIVANKG